MKVEMLVGTSRRCKRRPGRVSLQQLAPLDVSPRPARHIRVGLSRKPLGRELLFDEVEDPGVNGLPVGSVRVDQVHAMGEAVALQQDVRLPSRIASCSCRCCRSPWVAKSSFAPTYSAGLVTFRASGGMSR